LNKKQIFRRLAQIVIVLIGISFITFLLTYLSPGDPVRNMFSATGVMPTEELVQQTRDELGLNDPFLTQYVRWLTNCLRGDFGKSYSLNKPVVDLLAARLLPTLKLTLMSLILMLLMAVPLGVASALHKDSFIDYVCRAVTFVGCAMPNFWVGLLLMLLLCVKIQIFPVIASGGDFKSLFLPALTLAIAMASKYTQTGAYRRAGGAEPGLCHRRGGQRRQALYYYLEECISQRPSAPDHHAGPFHRKPAWRYQRRRGDLFLSGPGQSGSYSHHIQRL